MEKLSAGLDHSKMILKNVVTLGRSELDQHAEELDEELSLIETSSLKVIIKKIK